MRRTLLAAIVFVVALALSPASAQAGEVTGAAISFSYVDTAGSQTNDLTITRSGATLVFTDTAGLTENSTQCDPPTLGGTRVSCNLGTQDLIIVVATLAGGNDDLDASGLTPSTFLSVTGGAGEDDLTGGPAGDTLEGEGENDTISGNAGLDSLSGGAGNDVVSGGADNDVLTGQAGTDNLQGGDGNDRVDGGADADTLSGGANGSAPICGDWLILDNVSEALVISFDGVANDNVAGDTVADDFESVEGGDGNDRLVGSDGENCFDGHGGEDAIEGRGGEDFLDGGLGVDGLDGGAGADHLTADSPSTIASGETYVGGDGLDDISLTASVCDTTGNNCTARAVSVTLDDQPNDGAEGEGDNIRSDIEDVSVFGQIFAPPEVVGSASVTGTGVFNVIRTSAGADTVDPGGGSDSVDTGGGDDTINARDGFSDRIECGEENDVANVDQLDIVIRCETVNRETVAVALEDLPPGVTFTVAAQLSPNAPTALRADATDDRGIRRVLFMDDERVLCNDDAAPFECPYQPRGEDVGRDTLIAVAIDTAEQAAFLSREVTVAKFTATRLSIAFRRGRASGALALPAALTQPLGCRGTVTVRVRRGRRTIATRKVRLSRTCRYRLRIRVRRGAAIQRELQRQRLRERAELPLAAEGAMRRPALRALVLALVIVPVLTAGVASAGVVSGTAGSYTFTDAGAETNELTVTRSGLVLTFTDAVTPVTETSTECNASGGVVTCTAPGGASDFVFLVLNMGGGNDKADAAATGTNTSLTVNGEAGQDELTGNPAGNTMSGGPQNDTMSGNAGFDSLVGGEGDDTLRGGADGDEIEGGGGADNLQGEDGTDILNGSAGADTISGGAQESGSTCGDRLDYRTTTVDLTITLDNVANDDTGDGDTFTEIESVTGGAGNDRLVGDGGGTVSAARTATTASRASASSTCSTAARGRTRWTVVPATTSSRARTPRRPRRATCTSAAMASTRSS